MCSRVHTLTLYPKQSVWVCSLVHDTRAKSTRSTVESGRGRNGILQTGLQHAVAHAQTRAFSPTGEDHEDRRGARRIMRSDCATRCSQQPRDGQARRGPPTLGCVGPGKLCQAAREGAQQSGQASSPLSQQSNCSVKPTPCPPAAPDSHCLPFLTPCQYNGCSSSAMAAPPAQQTRMPSDPSQANEVALG